MHVQRPTPPLPHLFSQYADDAAFEKKEKKKKKG